MSKKFMQIFFTAFILVGLLALTQVIQAQTPNVPVPAGFGRPDYNYTESTGCVRCHFSSGPAGDHMPEAVGLQYNETKKEFFFTGSGWRASAHSQSNYKSTQNTYCAKCHSPLQASAEAAFKPNAAAPIADGAVEGVTCAACHPSHTAAVTLGRRLGIYQFGKDKATADAYTVIHEGQEDLLCLNCHQKRHNEGNAAFDLMVVAGVRCIDCHMAPYGAMTANPAIQKLFHDFKVAKNLPYSCGVEGSVVTCHPGFSVASTAAFIPYLKDQHKDMWVKDPMTKKLNTAAQYLKLWKQLEAQVTQ